MQERKRRLIWIVLDSCGVGAAADALDYGDADVMSNTIGHVASAVGGLNCPNLASLGLGNVTQIEGVLPTKQPSAFGKMQEQSHGKDTTNGHLEFVGVVLDKPLPTFPDGFPYHIIQPFEAFVGEKVLANKPASGTVVVEEYGAQHMTTGQPIVYTSADSVFQIAAHEDVVPIDTLYEWCRYARSILTGEDAVGRVIARPFVGKPGHFERTDKRRDFSLTFGDTALNAIEAAGYPVIGIGKIGDIYGGSGVTEIIHTHDNSDGMRVLMEQMDQVQAGLLYINLVDFDSKYGHRNDAPGFAYAIESFDVLLGDLLAHMDEDDWLCITADHGCDPTVPGTDHTREYVPVLFYHHDLKKQIDLGLRTSFADLGATISEFFGALNPCKGTSFLSSLM